MDSQFYADENSFPDFDQGINRSDCVATQEEEVIKDSDTLLVETIANYPALWNKQSQAYHDSIIRENCWMMIATVLNKAVVDCQKRWGQLRDSFTGERRKRDKESRSGSGATKHKGFSLYNAMEFLQPHIKQNKSTFTNVASMSPVNATSALSTIRLPLSSVQEYIPSLFKRHAPPVITSRSRYPWIAPTSSMLIRDGSTSTPLFTFFPPTPPENQLTPPENKLTPPLNTPTPQLLLSTATSPLRAPTAYNKSEEAHATTALLSASVSSFFCDKVPDDETSTHTGMDNINYAAESSTPPSRTPTPGQSISETPGSTPSRPCSRLVSPCSPYSPYAHSSSSIGTDDLCSLYSPLSTNQPARKAWHPKKSPTQPKACFTKDSLKTKKVDEVEASFISLSAALQTHLRKPVTKEAEAKDTPDGEQTFGNLIAFELGKMDDATKKIKKSRLLQILYE